MLVAALALALQAAAPVPDSPEHAAVMEPVHAVFGALSVRDGSRILPHVDAEARITAVIQLPDGARVRQPTVAEFAGGLTPGPERFEEIMADPLVRIDGDIAMVWGEYLFRVDGEISHCGVNHFDLVRRDGAWKIANLTWTQRSTGCEAIAARAG